MLPDGFRSTKPPSLKSSAEPWVIPPPRLRTPEVPLLGGPFFGLLGPQPHRLPWAGRSQHEILTQGYQTAAVLFLRTEAPRSLPWTLGEAPKNRALACVSSSRTRGAASRLGADFLQSFWMGSPNRRNTNRSGLCKCFAGQAPQRRVAAVALVRFASGCRQAIGWCVRVRASAHGFLAVAGSWSTSTPRPPHSQRSIFLLMTLSLEHPESSAQSRLSQLPLLRIVDGGWSG